MKAFFVFSGQGAQAVGMGRDFFEQSAAARKIFQKADEVLGYSISDICFNGPENKLTRTIYCQNAIYVMSCAALSAFQEKFPEVKMYGGAGLSLGEYAALYAGKAFSFENGLKLLAQRAKFMEQSCQETSGGMASVLGGDVEIIRQVCHDCGIYVANYNNPGQIVISGDRDKLENAVAALKEKGMRKVIVLNVAGAFHSELMASAGEKLRAVLAEAEMVMPEVPIYQNYTSEPAGTVAEIKENLARQVAGSVRWEECVRKLAAGGGVMIEFGPGTVLTGLMRRTIAEVKSYNVNSMESLNNIVF